MGTGTAVATGDIITAAKMNLKLETIVDADLTHDSGDWTVGVDGAGQDIIYYTDTAGRVMTWDPSDDSLELDDDVILAFGDADDVEIKWDGAKLSIIPLTDDTGYIIIGDATHSFDFKWLGSDGDHYVLFDLGDNRLTLDDIDLYLGDNDMLVFGDGADITMKWDEAKLLITPAAEFDISMAVGHFILKTTLDTKNIRLNSRDYPTATAITETAVQIKPRASVDGLETIQALELGPGFNDGVGGNSLIGLLSDCYLKGTSGDLSGDIRAVQGQVTDENSAGRTIGGIVSMFDAWQQLAAHTFTGGVYVMTVRDAGGATPWSGLLKLPDDSQVASDGEDKSGGTKGWIKVKIGTKTGYIQVEQLA